MALKRKPSTMADDENNATLVMPGVADIIEVREESWGEIIAGWARSLLGFLLVTLLLVLVLYTVLAATVLFVTNVGGREILVARNTYVAGIATQNTEIYTSTQPTQDDFFERIRVGYTGAPNASLYTIASKPFDTVKFDGTRGLITIGERTVGKIPTGSSRTVTLNGQYLASCQAGYCKMRGETYTIIDADQIYGQVKRG